MFTLIVRYQKCKTIWKIWSSFELLLLLLDHVFISTEINFNVLAGKLKIKFHDLQIANFKCVIKSDKVKTRGIRFRKLMPRNNVFWRYDNDHTLKINDTYKKTEIFPGGKEYENHH